MASKNFGETSLVEIREMLQSKGLELGQFADQIREEEPAYDPETLSADERAMLDRPIAELNLSVRARKCMVRLGPVHDRRIGAPHGRRSLGMQELRRHEPQRSPREADDSGPEAARRLSESRAESRESRARGSGKLLTLTNSMTSSAFGFDILHEDAGIARAAGAVHHAARRRRNAGVHAGRHAGHREGRRPGPPARNRRADDPGQHVSPRAAARRANRRGARRAACVHGLGRADPDR